MLRIGLFDEEFRHLQNYSGYDKSEKMEWVKDSFEPDILVFTERCYEKALAFEARGKIKCAMPLEPQTIHDYAYDNLRNGLHRHFDYILTHNDSFADWALKNSPAKPMFWTPGGSWVWLKDWQVYPKSKNVSIVASMKDWTEGHRLRQAVIGTYPDEFDMICGFGRQVVENKVDIYKDFRYTVSIMNTKINTYWTDIVLDAFATGTVPIIWACPCLDKIFNPKGFIPFDRVEDLKAIFESIGPEDYEKRLPAIKENFELAKEYAIVEDFLYEDVFSKIMLERGLPLPS